MTIQQQLAARYRQVAPEFRRTTGAEPPPFVADITELAKNIQAMVATLNGRRAVGAGEPDTIRSVELTIRANAVTALVEAVDVEGRLARVDQFHLGGAELHNRTTVELTALADAAARQRWGMPGARS